MSETDPALRLGPVIGGLGPNGARLWGRAGGPGRLHAWVGRESDLRDASLLGISLPLVEEWGFSGVVPLVSLEPDTRYYYSLTLSDTHPDPGPAPYPNFQTAPEPGTRTPFGLAFGSCFLPEDRMGGGIFRQIEARRDSESLRFLMMLGDQIYAEADARNGIGKIAVSLDEYRAIYEYNWSRPPLQSLLANLPAFLVMDDHEVDNDWYWRNFEKTQARIPWFDRLLRRLMGKPLEERSLSPARVASALQAYWENQAMHAPIPADRLDGLVEQFSTPSAGSVAAEEENGPDNSLRHLQAGDWGPFYYDFVFGGAAFFVFDLRSQRVRSGAARQLLGEEQWQAFESWLQEVKQEYPLKFLVTSSSLFFDMWVDVARDRWNGFPEERDRLFRLLSEAEVEGAYILTGDLHSSHAIHAAIRTESGNPLPVWEFCASPFEQSHSILARYTYHPVKSEWLVEQHLDFRAAEYCFGVVDIDFPVDEDYRVKFKVYGEQGNLMAQAG
ncbi:MAG: alkaline phosphatase D family protein [Anaerolineales bacterium]|nr:alkaline phosphatase D family protein [Anaerolineales bacterium]